MTVILETERLIIRQPDSRDWPGIRDVFMSDRAQYIGGPYELGRAWRQFAAEVGHWSLCGCGMWAVTDRTSGEFLGLVGPWTPADWPEKEIGWFAAEAAQGTGVIFEAAQVIVKDAFERLGWDTAVSYISHGNTRSIALAERLGATLDPDAEAPGAYPCHVYRHPNPKVVS